MKKQIQWAISSNSGRSMAANSTRMVNVFAEELPPDSKTPVVVYGTPGTAIFSQLPTGPVLGLHEFKGDLYAVTPTNIYRIQKDGTHSNVGSVVFANRVSIDDNGIQLVIVDGINGYYFDGTEVKQLQGDGWFPANTVTEQDGYFIFNRAGTGQFFISSLLSVDLDPLEFATAEGSSDNTVATISNNRELFVFGTNSIEVWYNSGNALFPFERLQGAFIDTGTASAQTIVKLDSGLFFLGDDGVIYRTMGYQPARISTHAIEYSIAGIRKDDAYAWEYKHEGHNFYLITFPSINKTWCYDVTTGIWHERSHIVFGRHVGYCHSYCYEKDFVGDFQSGNVYQLSMDALTDHGSPIVREMVAPAIHANRARMFCHEFEVDMQGGLGLDVDPQAMLQWSDDGGKTWSNESWASIGKIGEYLTRVRWTRLGSFRQRVFKLTISDPIPVIILSAFVEVEVGRN